MSTLLDIKDLHVYYDTYAGVVQAVRGVSFSVNENEVVAVVGESGCGKTVTAKTVMGLLRCPPGRLGEDSQVLFLGKNIYGFTEPEWGSYRGRDCAMIFQDALAALNPTMRIYRQIEEVLILHTKLDSAGRRCEVIRLLESVGIPDPEHRMYQYPHEFSGGQRQRIMIAMALACSPKLLIADEPTTSLDVTVQAQILDLIRRRQRESKAAVMLITHDLGIVASMADRIVVMYGGRVMEQGSSEDIFYRPRNPYTWALIKAVPRVDLKSSDDLTAIEGSPPDLICPPEGCAFHPRCPYCMEICRKMQPEATTVLNGHQNACWLEHPLARKTNPYLKGGCAGANG